VVLCGKVFEEEYRMVIELAEQTRLDEVNRCADLEWNQNPNRLANILVPVKKETSQTRFEGLIHGGQNVILTGDQSIGKIVKVIPDVGGQVSHLIVRTAHFWDRKKILPVELVSDVNVKGVWLTIDRSKFQKLPDYKTDASITDEVKNSLWNDEVLRVTDYHEVDVRVKNGVVILSGHILSVMNQERIENAVKNVKSILGLRNHLIADDKLLLKVAEALIPIGRIQGNNIFTKVENGIVGLSGKVISAEDRGTAEQCAANVPWVRGVINHIAAPGVDQDAEEQPFIQPSIGKEIFFRDGLFGFIKQVVINRNNRCVVGLIIQGQFPDRQLKSGSMTRGENLTSERLAVIPVSVIRYLTSDSGFLNIDSTETSRYQDFDPANFVTPNADWVPPYPYCTDHVRFSAE
jgi:osmotically-inducible protein OsmY